MSTAGALVLTPGAGADRDHHTLCAVAVAQGLPAAGLVLLSYPLHPPGKPESLRVDHFPALDVPCLFS